uniref:Tyrosine-protein phosphatase domain-containing protein n=1 Tax=Heterorhabditis bacteriophora TaxID=37862 RepID=A0A1I7WVK3_HETBA
MLEAMDIILISIGSILLILFFIVTITVLFHSRRKNQRKAENARRAAAKEYYLDHPVSPLNYTFSDNNEKAKSSLEVPPILLLEQEYASKHFGIMNEEKSTIVVVSESEEMTENTSRNLNIKEQNVSGEISGPVKKANRPSKIQINNTEARAVQAKAVETDHSVKKFEVEISRILSTDHKVLLDEFEILETRDSQRERNCIAAEQNMELNRFMDILPSDDTRVILRGTKNYINASLIDGYCNSGQFIATQGPIGFEETVGRRKESTVDDFWRMVWEKNVRCIIMLTDCMENMKVGTMMQYSSNK